MAFLALCAKPSGVTDGGAGGQMPDAPPSDVGSSDVGRGATRTLLRGVLKMENFYDVILMT